MLKSLWTALFTCAATSAIACLPDPDTKYDTFFNSEALIAVANVASATAQASNNGGACFTVKYSTTELIKGHLPHDFSIVTCNKNISVEQFLSFPANEAQGYVTGASVIVSVVWEGRDNTKLRYFIPGCWGPLHVRLDTLSPEERKHTLHLIREGIDRWNKFTLMP